MRIPSSDPESAHQIGLDDIWFMSSRGDDLIIFQCSKLICLQHGLQVSYADFVSRFRILSKNKYTSQIIPNGAGHISQLSTLYVLIICSGCIFLVTRSNDWRSA